MTVAEYNLAVNEYADNVYRFILKNIREENAAQDIMQDTYEKLWIKHEKVSYSKVKSYLFTAAYHTMIDFTRRQRNQVEIFISNLNFYLKKDGIGVLMVKARSIDVSLKPEKAYELVISKLKAEKIKIVEKIDLKPYEKDHTAIIISN